MSIRESIWMNKCHLYHLIPYNIVENHLMILNKMDFFVEHMDHCGVMKTFHQRTKPQTAPGS